MAASRRLFPGGVNTAMQNVCRPVPACRNAGPVRPSHRSEALCTPASPRGFVFDAVIACLAVNRVRAGCLAALASASGRASTQWRYGDAGRYRPSNHAEGAQPRPARPCASIRPPTAVRTRSRRTHVGEKAPRSFRGSVSVALSRRCRNERPSTFAGPPSLSPAGRVRETLGR